MKAYLLLINHVYLLFGATVYVGVLWALHFFWYPSWSVMTVDAVQDHFILPTSAATAFFTYVVPVMFVAAVVMIWTEWKTRMRWPAIIAFLGITGATFVGQFLIIPVNKTIKAGVSPEQLTSLLRDWMTYNDIRWIIMTVMWLALVYYFVRKGELIKKLAGES